MATDLIESRISEIRARLAAATPGPWEAVEPDQNEPIIYAAAKDEKGRQVVVLGVDNGISGYEEGRWIITDADHALITHAPSDLEALLAEREGMKAEIERLREDLRCGWCGGYGAVPLGGWPDVNGHEREGPCPCEDGTVFGQLRHLESQRRARLSAPLDPSSAPTDECATCQHVRAAHLVGECDGHDGTLCDCKGFAGRGSPDREAGSGVPSEGGGE